MVDIKGNHSVVTDNSGNSSLDLKEADEGKYKGTFNFAGDLNYADATVEKTFNIYKGLTTRILVNDEDLTTIKGKYYDNTSLTCVLQYQNNDSWFTKQIYTLTVEVVETGDKFTLTNQANKLDISKFNVGTYTLKITYERTPGYLPVYKTLTYTQEKNNITIENISDIDVYGDINEPIKPIIKTTDGKPVLNKVINMTKQSNTYSSVTDKDGVATFSTSLDFSLATDFTDDCTQDNTSNYTGEGLTFSTDHYVLDSSKGITINNLETLINKKIDFDVKADLGILVIKTDNGNIMLWLGNNYIYIIIDSYMKTFTKEAQSIVSVALHNNVLKIYNNHSIIYAVKLNGNYSQLLLNGKMEFYDITAKTLPDATTLGTEVIEFYSPADDNLNSASASSSITVNEYQTFDLSYKLDGYDTDKLMNVNSILSIDKTDLEDYGVGYVDNSGHMIDANKITKYDLNDFYESNAQVQSLRILFYGKKKNTAYSYIQPDKTVSVEDWDIYDKDNYGGVNIVLEANKTSVNLNDSYTLTASLGVVGKELHFYENKVLKATKTTGADGKCSLNVTASTNGDFGYYMEYDGDMIYPAMRSNNLTVSVKKIDTTLTLQSSNSSVPVGSTVSLVADLSVAVSGLSINFYKNGSLLGTAQTNGAGVATYSTTINAYGSTSYTALFEGNAKYVGSSSKEWIISGSKISTSMSASIDKSSINSGDSFNIYATLSPALSGVIIDMIDNNTGNILISQTTNSSGSVTFTYSETGSPSGYYKISYTGNSQYVGSYANVTKPTVIVAENPVKTTGITITSGTDYYPGWQLKGTLQDSNGNYLSGQQINAVILYDVSNNSGIATTTTDSNGNWSVPVDVSNSAYLDKNLQAYVVFPGKDNYNKTDLYKTVQLHGSTTITATTSKLYNFYSGTPYCDWTDLFPENVARFNDGIGVRCGSSCSGTHITPISGGAYQPNRLAVVNDINIPANYKITGIRVVYSDIIYPCNGNYITIANSDVGVYNTNKQELGHNSSSGPGKGVITTHTYDVEGDFGTTTQLNLLINYAGNPTANTGIISMDYIMVYARCVPIQS